MGIIEINQFLPVLHYGDAIGQEAISIKEFFIKKGFKSEIYTFSTDKQVEGMAKNIREYEDRDDIKIYHYAIPSELTDFFLKAKGLKVLRYHNITPYKFFYKSRKDLFRIGYYGRKELIKLKSAIHVGVGDSEYNRKELEEIGYPNTFSFPLMINFPSYKKKRIKMIEKLFLDGKFNIFFAGRIVPNKKIEDLIKIFFYFKKYVHQNSRLIISGNTRADKRYYYALLDYRNYFFLTEKDVVFTGHIPYDEFLTLYQISDVFMTMSEHEGFCLPLVEAMIYNLPIVAYKSTAIPYTLDGAGVMVKNKNPALVGELLFELKNNEKFREKVLSSQEKRIKHLKKESSPELFFKKLKEAVL